MFAARSGRFVRVLAAAAVAAGPAAGADALPRFTEEREAAALHFVRKHLPELVPPLDELKRSSRAAYEQQVRETFQITEYLADLRDDPKRYDLELSVWKAENRALVLAARAVTTAGEERAAAEARLQTVARELVDLDIKAAEYRVGVLERELAAARTDLAKSKDDPDRAARERYDGLLERARKRRAGS
ncbi:MAG: hypothetical protein K2X87_27245 [Gemmataceae bacterium]|nr:hypothetical protein [Gemmataceae bacterium]